MEHVFDKPWARAHLGSNLDNHHLFTLGLWLRTWPTRHEGDLLRSGFFSMVVLDSIGAMHDPGGREGKGRRRGRHLMAQAKIVTRMVKIAAVEAYKSNSIPLMINQVRANVAYGADTMTGGGDSP